MGICSDYLAREFGCIVEEKESYVTLNTTAPVVALINNPNRLGWTIYNLAAGIAFLGFTGAVSGTFGILVPALGGWQSTIAHDEGELCTHQLWAISTGAATTLYILETIGVRVTGVANPS